MKIMNLYSTTIGNSPERDLQRFFTALPPGGPTPFTGGDSSVGMEFELQVAVEGDHENVDLPSTIGSSTYFKNVVKRSARGDLSPVCLQSLKDFLHKNTSKVWENSWVRFPESRLTAWSKELLATDFLADKSCPSSRSRADLHRFRCTHRGQEWLRLPISYLLKLSLANAISGSAMPAPELFATGKSLMDNMLSDNTSPEILSFTIPVARHGRVGDLAAAESARTLLFCQLLIQYANTTLGLAESGQRCLLYCAPHAPSRQKHLNTIVPDSYYRHLFISPCLSGWNRGEEKYRYMELCHRTLSRSQLNTVGKLKDAGIITNNLMVLPNTSNTCLANNGTHVSLGSNILSEMAKTPGSPLTPMVEKYCGDLVIKIVEHFLPLLVNTYSAAPYRLDFSDFHPEKVLGFLPHELDYTHLRMIWRRWQKKAKIGFLGRTVTPFGPRWLDSTLAKLLHLRGDLVPDFRLVDYLVTLLSTETSPALNGVPGNHERLKNDLAEMGIFDTRMAMYLPYRQRIFAVSGYCGFEGRSYSLFHSLRQDMAEAVDIQNLITALAYRYVLSGRIKHHDIPDQPSIESERRQIFFGQAIGIPTFYVRANTGNRFLQRILADVPSQRSSGRYRGYIRVRHDEYNLALLRLLKTDAADLVAEMDLGQRLESLGERLTVKSASTFAKILAGVQGELPGKKGPFRFSAEIFNGAMERYYRTGLKASYLEESLSVLMDDCRRLEGEGDPWLRQVMQAIAPNLTACQYITKNRQAILDETADPALLQGMLQIGLAIIHHERTTP
ncbi:MAG: hypothetical protein OEL83_07580 [Desulforhopalus sp.]|nr:hypothetical protein [Desulforhopalus sp.]